ATSDIYTLSLHDALPIFAFTRRRLALRGGLRGGRILLCRLFMFVAPVIGDIKAAAFENQSRTRADFLFDLAVPPFFLRAKVLGRSEEHTSELQSLAYLVC